jgi:A/G-specific adenine glycosylase
MQADFTLKLLEWNIFHNQRPMPWKGEPDPYRIWLSEIILQQTRVEQGRAYYERFIKTFPDVHALANAPEEVYTNYGKDWAIIPDAKTSLPLRKLLLNNTMEFFPILMNRSLN